MTETSRVRWLRQLTGHSLRQFAKLTNCSLSTIRAAEKDDSRLSEKTAKTISMATGISWGWLTQGDRSNPEAVAGGPYTLESFKAHRESRYQNGGATDFLPQSYRLIALTEALGRELKRAETLRIEQEVASKTIQFLDELVHTIDEAEEKLRQIAELERRLKKLKGHE